MGVGAVAVGDAQVADEHVGREVIGPGRIGVGLGDHVGGEHRRVVGAGDRDGEALGVREGAVGRANGEGLRWRSGRDRVNSISIYNETVISSGRTVVERAVGAGDRFVKSTDSSVVGGTRNTIGNCSTFSVRTNECSGDVIVSVIYRSIGD